MSAFVLESRRFLNLLEALPIEDVPRDSALLGYAARGYLRAIEA